MRHVPAHKKILFVSPEEKLRILALQTVSPHNQIVIVKSLEESHVVLRTYQPDVIMLDQVLLATRLGRKDFLEHHITVAIITDSECLRGFLMSLEPPYAP
jgi:response regulator of citrate/malate metabolism